MRLRQALEQHVIAAGDPRRIIQLQAVRSLETRLSGLDRDLHAGRLDAGEALRQVIQCFAEVEALLDGADLKVLLGEGPPTVQAPGSTILTRGTQVVV